MISINRYLDDILYDFKRYLKEGHSLCKLKSVHFDQGQIPDYKNIHVQQYYLLRYAYGYAFEYKLMYETLLEKYPRKRRIAVTSIGCGTMLDYWALARVLKQRDKADISIRYTGIDLIDWNDRIPPRNYDNVVFYKDDAIDMLEECEQLKSNVYFFPKSISEFSDHDFKRLCKVFRTTPIKKNRIHILVSVRSNDGSMKRDCRRVQKLGNAILKNGFVENDTCSGFRRADDPEKKICKTDPDFRHPGDVFDCLKELPACCSNYRKNGEYCKEDCERRLSWRPILTQSQVCYAIFTYERKET